MAVSPVPENRSSQRDELEIQKLRLEIKGLRRAFFQSLAIALITAVVTVSIAVASWLVDRTKTRGSERQTRFTSALDKFSNADPSVREVAARELPEYAVQRGRDRERVLDALISRLQREDDTGVMESMVAALQDIGRPALQSTREANRRAFLEFARSSGRYAGLVLGKKPTQPERNSFFNDLDELVRSVEIPFEYEQPNSMYGSHEGSFIFATRNFQQPFQREIAVGQRNGLSKQNAQLVLSARDVVGKQWRRLKASSLALSRLIRSFSGQLSGEDLSGIVLIRVDLHKTDLHGASLQGAMLVSTNASESNFNCVDLSWTSLLAPLDEGTFKGANFTGMHLDNRNPFWEGFDEDANLWDADWGNDSQGKPEIPAWMGQYRQKHEAEWKQARAACPKVVSHAGDAFIQR